MRTNDFDALKRRIIFVFLFLLVYISHSVLSLSGEERLANKSKGEQKSVKKMRVRDLGVVIGIFKTGEDNAITDVAGVKVGQVTLIEGEDVRTGVTVILPHEGNIFKEKVPAAVYVGNGFGKLMGSSQINELGNIETPIVLTNTLSVWTAAEAVADYILSLEGNEKVYSVNPVIGETNDSYLNNIRKKSIKKEHIWEAIENARGGYVEEGNVGAGAGTVCFGMKGGIGTSSRVLPDKLGGFTIGVLVQTNYGGLLNINGIPVWKSLLRYPFQEEIQNDGSCMIIVATDAPISHHNLYRLAKRAILGLAKTGSFMSNGSGDYVIAFSTNYELRISYNKNEFYEVRDRISLQSLNALFEAVVEATEEAILNSLTMASSMSGYLNHKVEAINLDLFYQK